MTPKGRVWRNPEGKNLKKNMRLGVYDPKRPKVRIAWGEGREELTPRIQSKDQNPQSSSQKVRACRQSRTLCPCCAQPAKFSAVGVHRMRAHTRVRVYVRVCGWVWVGGCVGMWVWVYVSEGVSDTLFRRRSFTSTSPQRVRKCTTFHTCHCCGPLVMMTTSNC